jgi:hypothetical protein
VATYSGQRLKIASVFVRSVGKLDRKPIANLPDGASIVLKP